VRTRGVVLLEEILKLLELGNGELLELSTSALEGACEAGLSWCCHLLKLGWLKLMALSFCCGLFSLAKKKKKRKQETVLCSNTRTLWVFSNPLFPLWLPVATESAVGRSDAFGQVDLYNTTFLIFFLGQNW
jgi:hypothetical protein